MAVNQNYAKNDFHTKFEIYYEHFTCKDILALSLNPD